MFFFRVMCLSLFFFSNILNRSSTKRIWRLWLYFPHSSIVRFFQNTLNRQIIFGKYLLLFCSIHYRCIFFITLLWIIGVLVLPTLNLLGIFSFISLDSGCWDFVDIFTNIWFMIYIKIIVTMRRNFVVRLIFKLSIWQFYNFFIRKTFTARSHHCTCTKIEWDWQTVIFFFFISST